MWFKLIYILFLVSSLLYGQSYFGGFTPRQIFAVIMLLVCVATKNLKFDKYWVLYCIFIFLFGISSFWGGYSVQFIRALFGFYFVSYVAYCSTIAVIKQYDGLAMIIGLLICIGVVNSFLTILQMYANPLATMILDRMMLTQDNDFTYHLLRGDLEEAYALPGLFGSGVVNGYFSAVASLLALYSKDGKLHFRNICLWGFFIISLYCVQQRTALFVTLGLSILLIFNRIKNSSKTSASKLILLIVSLSVMAVCGYFIVSLGQLEDTRYSLGMDSTGRDFMFYSSQKFISEHFLLGGFYEFSTTTGMRPHNLLLNALIYSGFFGGIIIIVMMYLMIKDSIQIYKRNKRNAIVFLLIYLDLTLNSLLHNASLVSGDMIFWLIWGICMSIPVESQNSNAVAGN